MKKRSRLLTLVMTVVLVIGCLVGCGGKTGGDKTGKDKDVVANPDAQEIQISYWNSGLGTDWLDAVVKAFNEKHPEYYVRYDATSAYSAAAAAFGLEDVDTVDLYMAVKEYDTKYLEPLNDVLDTVVEGESKSIKDKFKTYYLEQEELNGKYYNLTYGGGVIGFVYNTKLFKEAGIEQAPRTTDELSLVCSMLTDSNITPLCHFKPTGYYNWMAEVWFSQYEGLNAYYNFYKNPSKELMLKRDGRYKTLQAMEKIVTPEYVLTGSNSDTHTSVQTKFLAGKAAIMLNGSWLCNEMGNTEAINDFVTMKTPVISSITDKLTSVKTDKDLREVISAIDAVTDSTKKEDEYKDGSNYKIGSLTVSAEDWDYVRTARNTTPQNFSAQTCFIPSYSDAKDGAKEFLKFLYSDEGYKIYTDILHIQLPLEMDNSSIDTSSWNNFLQNQADLMDTTEYVATKNLMSAHDLFTHGNACAFGENYRGYVNLLCSNSEADRIDAGEAWDYIVNLVNDKYEKSWMKDIE